MGRVDGAWLDWPPAVRPDGTPVWVSYVLGLAVHAEGLFVRFDHPQRGPLPLRRELYTQLAEERRVREDAERRLAELQDELRRLRGE